MIRQIFMKRKFCSFTKFKYPEAIELEINNQIQRELNASHIYLSMASFFAKTEISKFGFSQYFHRTSLEERAHALKLIEYQNMRGGTVLLKSIESPAKYDWIDFKNSLIYSMETEKNLTEKLIETNRLAEELYDLSTLNLITDTFLPEQMKSIQEIGCLMSRLCEAGEYFLDKELRRKFEKNIYF